MKSLKDMMTETVVVDEAIKKPEIDKEMVNKPMPFRLTIDFEFGKGESPWARFDKQLVEQEFKSIVRNPKISAQIEKFIENILVSNVESKELEEVLRKTLNVHGIDLFRV